MPNNDLDAGRRCLALVCNTLTPYRVNLHRKIAAEFPELKILTLVTHGDADFKWRQSVPEEIHASYHALDAEAAHGGIWGAPAGDWKKGAELIDYLRAKEIAAVIFTGYSYFSHLRLLRYCFQQGWPVFLRNDSNICIDRNQSLLKRQMKRLFYRWARKQISGVMPMGTYGEEFFQSYRFRPQEMYRVPYTPDYDWFAKASEAEISDFRNRFELSENRRYFMFSGRLHPVKRVDLVLDAFRELADERSEWDLLIVGDGPQKKELCQRVPQRLRQRVHWTGFLQMDPLRVAYHVADVLVLPSRREAWGVVVQEALAAGLPVIASDVVGAARDLVEPGRNGMIFPSGSVDALASAMRDVSDPTKLEGYVRDAAAGLQRWLERVDAIAEIRRALQDVQTL